MNPAWVASLTALAVAVFGLASWAARHGWHLLRSTYEFLIEWGGKPAHHGLPATPGVLARLQSMEQMIAQVASEVTRVAMETKPNGGSSLHDVMTRTERAVDEIRAEQAKMRARMEQLETQRHDRDDREGG